ncbi:uncharacterized protein [Macaca nemestrina]|uniref:uncharacterized protein isoform X1 n=1 Tax=Macaca nemestrina TaxID=9545 RepID=UPI0039B8ED63
MFLGETGICINGLHKEESSSPNVGAPFSPLRAPTEKKKKKGEVTVNFSLSLPELGCPSSSALGRQNSSFSGFWTVGLTPAFPVPTTSTTHRLSGLWPQTESYIDFLGSEAFIPGLSHATAFPGSPACRRPVVTPLSLSYKPCKTSLSPSVMIVRPPQPRETTLFQPTQPSATTTLKSAAIGVRPSTRRERMTH